MIKVKTFDGDYAYINKNHIASILESHELVQVYLSNKQVIRIRKEELDKLLK